MELADDPSGAAVLYVVLGVLPLIAAVLGILVSGRIDRSRSVLVHAPVPVAWSFVHHFPTLHERHGRARDLFRISRWELRIGDGESSGSVWRAHGDWEGLPYWVDVELTKVVPERQVELTLHRDALGTHRGLRGHLGTLTLDAVGSDATKVTWRLRARLRSPRLRLARLTDTSRLRARLFDQGLRSLKVEIDNARVAGPLPRGPVDRDDTLDVPPPTEPGRPQSTL